MREDFKKIALRLVLLGIIFMILNTIYLHTFYKDDTRGNGDLLEKLEKGIHESEVLYFSASPNQAYAPTDVDKRNIAEILDDFLPDQSVTAIDTGGIHAGIFKKLIRLVPEKSSVKYVVVNMNYRSFGISWIESALENALQKQSVFYNNNFALWNRFLQGLNHFPTKTTLDRENRIRLEWKKENLPYPFPRNSVSNWCEEYKWGDWQNPTRNLADHYIKNFAFVLDEQNPRVKDFDEIVEICKTKDIQLIFTIIGENMEEGGALAGDDLIKLMQNNNEFLINRY